MDALGPTAPQHALQPRNPAPSPHPQPRAVLAAVIVVVLVVGLAIGVLIGRGTSTATVVAPPPLTRGHLRVASKPTEGNVVVDGRFVGVSPIDQLDLDAGKHSVVIDAFGYLPYAGTLAIEPQGTLNLSVTLAPLGGDAPTIGSVTGVGTAQHAVVPPSALLPATAAPATPEHKPAPHRSASAAPAVVYVPTPTPAPEPPARPRRDCAGDKSRCRDGCSRAETDCRFGCPTCTTCSSSIGTDECRRQCDSCRGGCDQNTKFCESSCDSQYNNCEASQ